jgi:lysozyme family protein
MAASTYDEALRRLLRHEGGYVNHPSDPGGPTNFGITLADFRRYVKADATAADIQSMKVEHAKAIYRTKYWNALRCDALPAGLDYAAFDYGVNSGTGRAAKVLCAIAGSGGSVIGDVTLAHLRARDSAKLIAAICDERLAFLKRLKTWPVFGAGWGKRVAGVRAAALAMAAGSLAVEKPTKMPAEEQSGPGKGVVPVNTTAQRGTVGGAIASGGAAAEQAHSAGASAVVVVSIVVVALLAALAAWVFWRWRQQRQQEAISSLPALASVPSVDIPHQGTER